MYNRVQNGRRAEKRIEVQGCRALIDIHLIVSRIFLVCYAYISLLYKKVVRYVKLIIPEYYIVLHWEVIVHSLVLVLVLILQSNPRSPNQSATHKTGQEGRKRCYIIYPGTTNLRLKGLEKHAWDPLTFSVLIARGWTLGGHTVLILVGHLLPIIDSIRIDNVNDHISRHVG